MASEQTTDVTNFEAATPTGGDAETITPTSNTEATTTGDQPNDPPAEGAGETDDGLGGDTLLSGDDDSGGNADGDATADEPALVGAPDGEYTLELGEDAGFEIAPEDLEAITPLAKELNLSNKGLSRIVQEGVPLIQQATNRAIVDEVMSVRKGWEGDTRAMVQGGKDAEGNPIPASPVFAGENLDAVVTTGARAIDRFTNDENGQPRMFPGAKADGSEGTFRDFLKTTGLGNHPAMIQFAYLAGKAISEDSAFERSGDAPQTKLSREEKYYPRSQT